MKQILGNLCRASVAAAGVMAAASTASAETKPFEFETEFDVGGIAPAIVPGVATAGAPTIALDVPAAVGNWEQSIGAYLDDVFDTDTDGLDAAPQPAAPETTVDVAKDIAEVLDPVVRADVAAFTTPAPEANPLLLAPVLSHPADCEACRKLVEQAEADESQDQPAADATTEAKVDDTAAWQKLADWASARVAEDEEAAEAAAFDQADVVTAESVFFEDAIEDPTTN